MGKRLMLREEVFLCLLIELLPIVLHAPYMLVKTFGVPLLENARELIQMGTCL